MAIRVTCGVCQKSLSVKEAHAGKSGKCPQCGSAVAIPALGQPELPSRQAALSRSAELDLPVDYSEDQDFENLPARRTRPPTAAKDPNQVMREILSSFDGEFPRFTPTLAYRFAALIVAIFMVLLPLVYIGLIGLVGYVLVWHATTNHAMFAAVRGVNAAKGAAFLYFAPLIIGSVGILFMLKPLFAPPAKRRREIELSFGDEPVLHSFVLRLCEAVKAPRPTVIEVDCDLGATAYFRNGWWGFFTNDFVIRIGLPLISTLDTRQLSGVLAHELSHFSQVAGMRLSYVIRSINDWLYQVAFEEDAWDEAITEWGENENNWISILANLSHMFVILGQILLMFLHTIGHVVSCALLRQMEYDADKFGTQLAGSDTFEATARRLMELTLAKSLTERISKENEGEGHIPDNLPLCLATIFHSLPSTVNVNEMTDSLIESGRTGWFYSEPAYRDRIQAAHRQQAPGIFHLERPAKVLMRNLTKTAEAATLIHYNRLIGKSAVKRQLTATSQFLSRLGLD